MKKYFGILFVVSLLFTSCENWIDPEINIDPDNPKEVSMGVLLPAIEGSFGYYYGGIDIVGIQSVWMQQLQGQDRQFVAINNYNIRQSDPNNLWNSMYQGVMMDIQAYIEKASNPDALDDNAAGVGKVLMALSMATVTDVWGDVPYSEALMGNDMLTPAYDPQSEIYAAIIDMLDDAIVLLQSSNNTFGIQNDYIYGGDPAAWMKAAYTLRARYNMRLTKVATVDYAGVIADVDMGIAANSEDMEQPYDGSSSAGYNPLYQFVEQRSGYVGNNPVFDTVLIAGDPRDGYQSWSADGFWSSQGSPVSFVSYAEALFLKAEAQMMSDEAAAKLTLLEAINASLDKYGVLADAGTWIADKTAEVNAASGDALLEILITEKYKHNFAHPEAYNDWRRTGYPMLTPVVGSAIPRRYPMAQDEVQYNPNTPEVNIYQRVWWDAE